MMLFHHHIYNQIVYPQHLPRLVVVDQKIVLPFSASVKCSGSCIPPIYTCIFKYILLVQIVSYNIYVCIFTMYIFLKEGGRE